MFDGRPVYKNRRLNGSWYFLHVDELDYWIINEQVPDIDVPTRREGWCDENVATPDLCSECWFFAGGRRKEELCIVTLNAALNNSESNCIPDIIQ